MSSQHDTGERAPVQAGVDSVLRRGDLLQAVIEDSPLGIVVSDAGGRVEIWNPTAERIFGWNADEVIGGPNPAIPAERRTEYLSMRAAALRGEGISAREVWRMRKDGTAVCVSLSVSALLDERGAPAGVIGLIADLSEQQHILEEKVRLEEQLRQSQKMEAIGRLAGGVAHDMNNVLQSILAVGELLQRALEPRSPLREHVRDILSACARGRDLTRDLLSFSRREPTRRERISLNELIEQVRSLLRRTIPRGITIRTDYAPDLGLVDADQGQLTHVLINLCINAADAMDGRGLLTLRTDNEELVHDAWPVPEARPGPHVRLEVIDTGAGMDEETLRHAFEPFYTTKPEGEGTGLGLSIVYGTISNHGGFVTIDSSPGEGTTVAIHLPVAALPAPAAVGKASEPGIAALGEGRVLLVDDEEIILRAWRRLLGRLGYETRTARNGQEALDILRAEREAIDLVVLDIIMPVMDGYEAFAHLRRDYPDLPVLIASGHLRPREAEELIARGAVGFLAKPFDVEHLAKVLQKIKGLAGSG